MHFIESEKGKSVRHGKKGFFAYPAIASLSSGTIEDKTSSDTAWLKVDGLKAETPFYSIEFAADGAIKSLKDIKTGREWVKGNFNKLHLYQDTPGMYDAWDILPNYDEVEYGLKVEKPLSLDAADSSIQFSSKIMPGMGDFTGDKVKLEEVILNLLQNARDAVGSEGSIMLSAERKNDTIIICCKDTGCGITSDRIDTIFDPFVTYKENGTGLGLSSAKRITEAHGGSIEVESSPESGTVFTVTLPV